MPEIRVQDRELRGEAEGRKVRQHREGLEDCAVAFYGTRAVGKQGEGLWAKGLNSNLKQNAPQRHLLYAKFKNDERNFKKI
jgi:hypothetical protein